MLVVDSVGVILPLVIKQAIDILNGGVLEPFMAQVAKATGSSARIWGEALTGPWALVALVCLFLGLHALVAYLRYWWRVFLFWSSYGVADRMRRELFSHLLSLHRDFFKQKKIGDLLSALTTDTESMRMTMSVGALMSIDIVINLILFPAAMFYLDTELAAYVFPVILLAAAGAYFFSGRQRPLYDLVQNLTGLLSGKTHELISGIRVVKAFGVQDRFFNSYSKVNDDFKESSLSVAAYQSFYSPTLEFVRSLCMVFVLIYGGFKVIEGRLELSSLIAFQIYLNYLDWPMMAMGWSLTLFRQSQAASARIRALTDTENPILQKAQEKAEISLASTNLSDVARPLIEARSLMLRYEGNPPKILGPFNLRLYRGQWLGLTGGMGSGKSTLLEALSRQRDPHEGVIYLEGQDIVTMSPEELRQRIIYVSQESVLFSKSIRSNLTLGEKAVSDAKLLELLMALEFEMDDLQERGGLDIRIGEKGVNFSGGQKQRLSLGRALLQERELYLFDDIFSHVDWRTEAKLLTLLKARLPQSAAVVLVSHRPTTLAHCTDVLELS